METLPREITRRRKKRGKDRPLSHGNCLGNPAGKAGEMAMSGCPLSSISSSQLTKLCKIINFIYLLHANWSFNLGRTHRLI